MSLLVVYAAKLKHPALFVVFYLLILLLMIFFEYSRYQESAFESDLVDNK